MADIEPLIVVGVDAAWRRSRALDWAVEEALLRRTPLRAIHVVDDSRRATEVFGMVKVDGVSIVPVRLDEAAAQLVAAGQRAVGEGGYGAGLRRGPPVGSPVEILAELSETALMLVVGRRGRGGFARLLIGSTSDAVASRGKGPGGGDPRWLAAGRASYAGTGRENIEISVYSMYSNGLALPDAHCRRERRARSPCTQSPTRRRVN
jgi:nucleotide-binding universal stress UspA family protein